MQRHPGKRALFRREQFAYESDLKIVGCPEWSSEVESNSAEEED
jgi:hypothetical protein